MSVVRSSTVRSEQNSEELVKSTEVRIARSAQVIHFSLCITQRPALKTWPEPRSVQFVIICLFYDAVSVQ
jgi:hypothetical protein